MLIVNGPVQDSEHEELGHPERPDRLIAALAGVSDLQLGDDLKVMTPYIATRAELARVHHGAYLDELGAFCFAGGGNIDEDTYATYDSWSIARYAAGAGIAVVDELRRVGAGVGFVAARPPGHHALADRAMGFCLLNNIAVTAAALTAQGERVLIVDWDVHHGNGTQSIFWNDPNVLYVSTHQWPLFPGSGGSREIGGYEAVGRIINIPVPAGTTGDVMLRAFDDIVAPAVAQFAPTWVLVSAGFDAHRSDPLADLALTSGDFALLARRVAQFAPRAGRLALFLEGGYDLTALRSSVAATLGALLDGDYVPEPASSGGPGDEHVQRASDERRIAIDMAQHSRPEEGDPR
jgi:acetoin utilization deacetylase AcuC-like enzyme